MIRIELVISSHYFQISNECSCTQIINVRCSIEVFAQPDSGCTRKWMIDDKNLPSTCTRAYFSPASGTKKKMCYNVDSWLDVWANRWWRTCTRRRWLCFTTRSTPVSVVSSSSLTASTTNCHYCLKPSSLISQFSNLISVMPCLKPSEIRYDFPFNFCSDNVLNTSRLQVLSCSCSLFLPPKQKFDHPVDPESLFSLSL